MRAKISAWRSLSPAQQARTVTPVTAQLLRHWRNPERERRLFFCQIEAVETAIWLAEVAPRTELDRLRALNADANPELFRVALKIATGAGKTTVMAMLIAWQTLNAARDPRIARFTDAFLIVTPGITIRDRLRVLLPNDPDNYYTPLDLVPPDMLRRRCSRRRIVITNYHAFQRRETMAAPKLAQGDPRRTRRVRSDAGKRRQMVRARLRRAAGHEAASSCSTTRRTTATAEAAVGEARR